jgi:hypothetical protein
MKRKIAPLLIATFLLLSGLFLIPNNAYAVNEETSTSVQNTASQATNQPNSNQNSETAEPLADTSSQCVKSSKAVSWILCPIIDAVASAVDSIYELVQSLFALPPLTQEANSPVYIVWNYMRSITNIVFVIFIIIIIYSQITGFGIKNYGIKKTLPRIIIAAILVNLSFIICTLAIDISNILGVQLHGLFETIKENAIQSGAFAAAPPNTWGKIAATVTGIGVGAGAVALAGGIGATFWAIAPLLLGALIAIVSAVLTLAARQALVPLLVMISPLAFVCYLLPNLEKMFKKWQDLLMKLLIFFPMFSLLFGGSQLASWVITQNAQNFFMSLIGLAVRFFPLFFAPTLLKMSGTVLGKVGDAVNKVGAPLKKGFGAYADEHKKTARAEHNAFSRAPSAYVARYLNMRKVNRENRKIVGEETLKQQGQEYANRKNSAFRKDTALNRALKLDGTPTKQATNYAEWKASKNASEASAKARDNMLSEFKEHIPEDRRTNVFGKPTRAIKVADMKTKYGIEMLNESMREKQIDDTDKSDYVNYLLGLGKDPSSPEYADTIGRMAFSRFSAEDQQKIINGTYQFEGASIGERSILSAAVAANSAEEKRVVEETSKWVKKMTALNDQSLIKMFKTAMVNNDNPTLRATADFLSTNGWNVKCISKAIKELETGTAEGFDSSKITAGTWDNLANHLSHGDGADGFRKKDIGLFYWALQRSQKDIKTGAYTHDTGLLTEFLNTKDAKNAGAMITDSSSLFSQTGDSLKWLFENGIKTQSNAQSAFADAMIDPTIVDQDKLAYLGVQAGYASEADYKSNEQAVKDRMLQLLRDKASTEEALKIQNQQPPAVTDNSAAIITHTTSPIPRPGENTTFRSSAEVRDAYRAGLITQEQAGDILRSYSRPTANYTNFDNSDFMASSANRGNTSNNALTGTDHGGPLDDHQQRNITDYLNNN